MPYDETDVQLTGPVIVDLTDVSTEAVAEGYHSVEVTSISLELNGKGKPQIVTKMVIIGDDNPEVNRTLTARLQLAGGGKVFTKAFFEAIGLDVTEVREWTQVSLEEEMVGTTLDTKVVHNPNKEDPNRPFANTTWYYEYGSVAGGAQIQGLADLGLDV